MIEYSWAPEPGWVRLRAGSIYLDVKASEFRRLWRIARAKMKQWIKLDEATRPATVSA